MWQAPTYGYGLVVDLKETLFRGSKLLQKFRTQKSAKIVNAEINKETDETDWRSMWNRRVATNIHLDHSTPLGSNGPHYVQSLHEVRNFLLNLVPGEPLALVQDLASFDHPIQLDLLLVSVLDLHVHDTICGGLFHVLWV